jgi:hypothetical protein
MSLARRRTRALLLGLVLPAALLAVAARSDIPWAGLAPWVALLLVPAFGLLMWIGKLGELVRWMEEALRRTAALWSSEPGALWLAWAAEQGHPGAKARLAELALHAADTDR